MTDTSLRGKRKQHLINDLDTSINTTYSSVEIENRLGRVAFGQNILHNWDFRNPVNQRGQSSYATNQNTIDRWRSDGQLRVDVNPSGISLSSEQTGRAWLQLLENPAIYVGKTLTFSVEVGERIYSHTITVPSITSNTTHTSSIVRGYSLRFRVGQGGNPGLWVGVIMSGNPDDPLIVKRAKLELGTVSTLANDPPMDFGKELAVCRRYFGHMSLGGVAIPDSGQTGRYFVAIDTTYIRMRRPVVTPKYFIVAAPLGWLVSDLQNDLVMHTLHMAHGLLFGTFSGVHFQTPDYVGQCALTIEYDANL